MENIGRSTWLTRLGKAASKGAPTGERTELPNALSFPNTIDEELGSQNLSSPERPYSRVENAEEDAPNEFYDARQNKVLEIKRQRLLQLEAKDEDEEGSVQQMKPS